MPWSREWSRGFNQSAILADQIHQLLGVPHLQLLQRIDATEQASKKVHHRTKVLTGRFIVNPRFFRNDIPNTILLVDDVVTSGATFNGCAIELLSMGVQRIICVALASGKLS